MNGKLLHKNIIKKHEKITNEMHNYVCELSLVQSFSFYSWSDILGWKSGESRNLYSCPFSLSHHVYLFA